MCIFNILIYFKYYNEFCRKLKDIDGKFYKNTTIFITTIENTMLNHLVDYVNVLLKIVEKYDINILIPKKRELKHLGGFKNMLNEKRLKDIASSRGYNASQIEIAFNSLNKCNIAIVEKEDDLFDIKDMENNEFLHKDVSIEMAIEVGFDILRVITEDMIAEGQNEADILKNIEDLNSMFVNRKYVLKENQDGKYLAIQF